MSALIIFFSYQLRCHVNAPQETPICVAGLTLSSLQLYPSLSSLNAVILYAGRSDARPLALCVWWYPITRPVCKSGTVRDFRSCSCYIECFLPLLSEGQGDALTRVDERKGVRGAEARK